MENIKVLIADDSSSVRKFLSYSLKNNFPEVESAEAATGKEAIAKLENERFDIILSDWDMPQLGGLELLKWVRGHPAYNTTPFIMLTTDSDERSVVKATQAGANAYLLKPIAIDALVGKLTTSMEDIHIKDVGRTKEGASMSKALQEIFQVLSDNIITAVAGSAGGKLMGLFGK